MNKGYIAPVILILLLLILAGIFIFIPKVSIAPVPEYKSVLDNSVKKSTSTSYVKIENEDSDVEVITDDLEENSSSTVSTTTDNIDADLTGGAGDE